MGAQGTQMGVQRVQGGALAFNFFEKALTKLQKSMQKLAKARKCKQKQSKAKKCNQKQGKPSNGKGATKESSFFNRRTPLWSLPTWSFV